MPTIDAAKLDALCATILGAAGVSSATAHSVAAHLVENDLRGIESHGCSRIPYYLGLIAERSLKSRGWRPGPQGRRRSGLRHSGHGTGT
jgi:LDH2 family malate/lactate/ureidoglycolate dehydrogenase